MIKVVAEGRAQLLANIILLICEVEKNNNTFVKKVPFFQGFYQLK